jgi:hypothetical protein
MDGGQDEMRWIDGEYGNACTDDDDDDESDCVYIQPSRDDMQDWTSQGGRPRVRERAREHVVCEVR